MAGHEPSISLAGHDVHLAADAALRPTAPSGPALYPLVAQIIDVDRWILLVTDGVQRCPHVVSPQGRLMLERVVSHVNFVVVSLCNHRCRLVT
jgi:hypothetical protein